jgi:enoyl-CoA hydratase/carnithine racemase
MLGDTIGSDEVDGLGLAYKVVEDETLAEAATELVRRLADGPALAYSSTKMLLSRELDMDLASSLELEATTQALLMTSEDHAEFYQAFTEGRDPKWTGR